jgi:hypothetical protein
MATTIKKSNVRQPAPRWFRITKKIIYSLTGSSILTGTLLRFGISNDDCLLIIGWMLLIGETLDGILANGEKYTKI